MIDVHSHIIHGVDDGPSNIEQSIRMVREAEKLGISTIIATPHYQENVYEAERVEENYQELLFRTSDYGVTVKLGYEVFVNPFEQNPLKNMKRLTLGRTKHVLLEFPFNAKPLLCIEAAKKLQNEGLIPIIAHPERNRNFLNKLSDLVSFVKMGCLIQIDAGSITGVYGNRIKHYAKRLVELNFADLVASNAHFSSDYTEWYIEAFKNVTDWSGNEYAHRLFTQNARGIMQNVQETVQESIYKVI